MKVIFRSAKAQDLKQLVDIESQCFATDRLSRASFLHFIGSKKSDLVVASSRGGIAGYFLLLYHEGTSLARLYSIAVNPAYQGKGLGRELMLQVEAFCQERDKHTLRLEVRPDNINAIKLYERLGFRRYQVKQAFYEDHSDAFCFEKKVLPLKMGYRFRIPYYSQNTEFTCGPAALIMAMATHSRKIKPSLSLELEIWREATTIFMTSGHGGCGPRGLALAAYRRGFGTEIWVSQESALFSEGVRSLAKKRVLKIVHDKFVTDIRAAKIPVHVGRIGIRDLERATRREGVILVLTSAYKLTKTKSPHWVVIAGHDERHFFIHDPDLSPEDGRFLPDVSYIPVEKSEFIKMARYGKRRAQAVVVVYRGSSKEKK